MQPWLSVQTLLFSGSDVYRRFRPGMPETPLPLYPENRTRLSISSSWRTAVRTAA